MTEQSPAEGWYPVDEHTERRWTGTAWSDATRPRQTAPITAPAVAQGKSPLVTAGIIAASIVGLVLSLQSASLLTGTGMIWTGVAIAVAATAFAFILKARRWVKVVVVIVALIGIANAVSVESSLADLREEISNDLG